MAHHVIAPSFSHVQLFATPWTAACQASLAFTISWHVHMTHHNSGWIIHYCSYLLHLPECSASPNTWPFSMATKYQFLCSCSSFKYQHLLCPNTSIGQGPKLSDTFQSLSTKLIMPPWNPNCHLSIQHTVLCQSCHQSCLSLECTRFKEEAGSGSGFVLTVLGTVPRRGRKYKSKINEK